MTTYHLHLLNTKRDLKYISKCWKWSKPRKNGLFILRSLRNQREMYFCLFVCLTVWLLLLLLLLLSLSKKLKFVAASTRNVFNSYFMSDQIQTFIQSLGRKKRIGPHGLWRVPIPCSYIKVSRDLIWPILCMVWFGPNC